MKKCVLIVPYFYIWKIEFFNFFLSCWKPLVPDGFWFLCYLLQVLRKISFLLLIDINMWHYKEYSPSSYMWKKKLWRIKEIEKNSLKNLSNCTIRKNGRKPSQFDEFFLHFILPKKIRQIAPFSFLEHLEIGTCSFHLSNCWQFQHGKLKCRVVESRTRASFAIKSTCKPR